MSAQNSNPDFFSDVESLSPKLLFLKKHGLETAFDAMWDEDAEKWSCYPREWSKEYRSDEGFRQGSGFGDTEEAAICDYCAKHGLTHYTLEGSK